MRSEDTWRVVAGAAALLLVSGFLLSTPSMIFAQKVDVVDAELRGSSGSQAILTRMDLGNPGALAAIPRHLGAWNASRDYDYDRVAAILNANVLLSRDYQRDDLFQPVNLLVIESANVNSFHPAPVCYRAQGYDVPADEGQVVSVPVPNGSWAKEEWLSQAEPQVFRGNLSAKLLEVAKPGPNGAIAEKRVALYVYLKREDWRVTDQVTWVRLETVIAPSATARDALPFLADLMKDVVPTLFSFRDGAERTLGESLLDHFGLAGAGLIAAAVVAPCWPIATAMRRSLRG